MRAKELQARAAKRFAVLSRKRRDPRYQRVLGRLVAAGVVSSSEETKPYKGRLEIEDVLWAGEVEPRFVELLPALIVKRPGLFKSVQGLPSDLEAAVTALRRNERPTNFRGVQGEALARWVPAVGHKNKLPSRLRSFRLQVDDLALLEQLTVRLGISQTAVLRRALRALALQTQTVQAEREASTERPAKAKALRVS